MKNEDIFELGYDVAITDIGILLQRCNSLQEVKEALSNV